ncbi:MAG: hypothetical protein NT077_02640 [Candidatus Taylorbacteria bacterium]|nr:hypothetical protein [Candidatus Taylorbacteria bacterium]
MNETKFVGFMVISDCHGAVLAVRRGEFFGCPCIEGIANPEDLEYLTRLFYEVVSDRAIMRSVRRTTIREIYPRQNGIWNNEPATFVFYTFPGARLVTAYDSGNTGSISQSDSRLFTVDFTIPIAWDAIRATRTATNYVQEARGLRERELAIA